SGSVSRTSKRSGGRARSTPRRGIRASPSSPRLGDSMPRRSSGTTHSPRWSGRRTRRPVRGPSARLEACGSALRFLRSCAPAGDLVFAPQPETQKDAEVLLAIKRGVVPSRKERIAGTDVDPAPGDRGARPDRPHVDFLEDLAAGCFERDEL